MADIWKMIYEGTGTDTQIGIAQLLVEQNFPDWLIEKIVDLVGKEEAKRKIVADAYIPPPSDLMDVRQGGHCFYIDHPSGRVERIAQYIGAGGEDRARRLFYDEHPEHFIPF